MKYLGNAFSLQMIDTTVASTITITPVAASDIPVDCTSCIGHPDTAAVVSDILGRDIPCNRISVALSKGDVLYVAQVLGGRLPASTTTLPDGFSMTFLKVSI
jgi:hypothetical protein